MKKTLFVGCTLAALNLASSALAADMPLKAPAYKAPPPVYVYSWTGCYVGGNVGGLWARKEGFDASPNSTTFGRSSGTIDVNGWLGGIQAGCNYQVGGWVFGIQGDYDWTNATGSSANLLVANVTNSVRIKSLASVTGRVGYAWDRFLGYVKGGGAWERDEYNDFFTTTGAPFVTGSETRGGWTVGIGGEYAFTDWLSGFAEYDYYNFGTRTLTFVCAQPGCGPGGTATPLGDIRETKSVIKVGLNVRFGYSPVVAKY
jgi:outer membrane immunogenic protein